MYGHTATSLKQTVLITEQENRLQDESQEQTDSQFQEDINKALHAMASHLHRYASELSSLEETLSEIAAHHKAIHDENTMLNDFQFQRIENGLRQVASQLRPIKHFETELEKKLQNILALVSRHQVRGVKVLKHSSFSIVSSSQMRTKHTS
jgi:uncharacterized phage infection (PIP) family protein YhgE